MPRLTPARAASAERPPPWIKAARARRESWCLSVLHISTWTHLWPRDRCYRQAEHLVVLKMHNVTKKGTISRKNKTNIPAISERKNKKKNRFKLLCHVPSSKVCPVTFNNTHPHTNTKHSVHMVSFTLAYVLGSILPSIPADRLFARPSCRCSGQNGRLSERIFWNKCPRSNCHCRWTGMSTLAPSAPDSAHPGTTHALFPTVYGWQKNQSRIQGWWGLWRKKKRTNGHVGIMFFQSHNSWYI